MSEDTPLTSFYLPGIPLEWALHKRQDRWYLVSARAYGMSAGGNKFNIPLNTPREGSDQKTAMTPGTLFRFWFREYQFHPMTFSLEALTNAEPAIFKDTGIKRQAQAQGQKLGAMAGPIGDEEYLVEVILDEKQFIRRCAYCGVWELTYAGERRFLRCGQNSNQMPVYWCGHCNKYWALMNLRSIWWMDPALISDQQYFS